MNTQPGGFELAWERAFGDYAATYPGHWRRSAQELAALLKAYPQFKGAAAYASWAQTQARREPLPQPPRHTLGPITLAILIALAALALALIAVTLICAARGRPLERRSLAALARRRRAAAAHATPSLSEQHGGPALLDALDDRLTPVSQRLN